MKQINFSIKINATRADVWNVLWNEETYNKWTRVFGKTSYAVSDWKEGSKILFVDGDKNGMVSKIETLREDEFMSFMHLGELKNGVEDTTSEHAMRWNGSLENYTLTEEDGRTRLDVSLQGNIPDEFMNFFDAAFPKALEIVKQIAEN